MYCPCRLNGNAGRNPISEAHIQRVEPKPRLQSAFPSYDGGSDLKVYDADEYLGLLIQSEGGALHLPDDMYSTFRRLAQRLLDLPLTGTDSFYVDIKEPGSQVATPYEIVDGDEGEATYRENIRTLLQDLNVEVRVRTGKIDRTRPFTNKDINSEYIQLTDAKVGYRWLRADWNENGKALLNSQYFVQNVRCLYPYAKNPKRNVNDVTIAIPGGPSFDINIEKNDQDNLADLHKIFSQLMETKRASKTDSEPLLISISKKGEPPLEVSIPHCKVSLHSYSDDFIDFGRTNRYKRGLSERLPKRKTPRLRISLRQQTLQFNRGQVKARKLKLR